MLTEKQKLALRLRYRKDPAYYRLKQQGYYHETRKEIIGLLGGKCVQCGFSKDFRALTIDHVHNNGSEERRIFIKLKSFGVKYYKLILKRIQEGSKDYQCLCANCNLIKKIEQDECRRKKD